MLLDEFDLGKAAIKVELLGGLGSQRLQHLPHRNAHGVVELVLQSGLLLCVRIHKRPSDLDRLLGLHSHRQPSRCQFSQNTTQEEREKRRKDSRPVYRRGVARLLRARG